MPRQLPPIVGGDPSTRKKLNQIIDDMTATADRATLSKVARISQSQLHQHREQKRRLKGGEIVSIRHQLGAIPSNITVTSLDGVDVQIIRTTKDRVYVRALSDTRADILIQR